MGGIAASRVVKGTPHIGGNYRYIFKWRYHCSYKVPLEIIRIPNSYRMVPALPFGQNDKTKIASLQLKSFQVGPNVQNRLYRSFM